MPRFFQQTAFALILCALAVSAFAAPRPRLSLLNENSRPPLFTLPDTQGQSVRLDTFLRRKRIVLLAIPAGPGLQGTAFLRAAREHRAEFDARDLVVLALAPPQSPLFPSFDASPVHMLHDANARIAHAYGGSSGTPAFYLIGKDGGIKLASRTFPSLRELFAAIDAMPMRREERSQRGR